MPLLIAVGILIILSAAFAWLDNKVRTRTATLATGIGLFIISCIMWIVNTQTYDESAYYIWATIFFAISLILIRTTISIEFCEIAEKKGYSRRYFWYPFLLGITGYLLIIALPNQTADNQTADNQKVDNQATDNQASDK